MQLFVRGGATAAYDATGCLTVGDVKALVEARQGVPACCQGLVFSGRQLQDDLPLSSYGLAHGSTLHLVLRLRGGKGGFGALLRGQGRDGNITTNFDACRDLQGRRLRHVEGEKKVKEWKSQAKERELEKVAMRHIRDKAREARKEEAEKVDVEAVKSAQRQAVERVQDAVQDALRSQAQQASAPASASASAGPSGSGGSGGAKRKAGGAAAGVNGGAGAAAAAKRPKVLAALEELSSDSDDDSASEEADA